MTNVPYLDLGAQIKALRPELDAAIGRVLDTCGFCLGPEVVAFENEFATYCGASHGIAVNSGTSALHLALQALGVGGGDEVITTPYTFAATSWAISYLGAKPVYVDVDPETLNMDPVAAEKAVTPRTKAFLPVHLYGHPFDIDAMQSLSMRTGIPLVEDAAQAHGAEWNGKKVGTFGVMSCFSFYPAKNLGACGEAGAVVTNDATLAARVKKLREHGASARYHHDEVGYNYRMDGLQGAILRVKLRYLADWTDRRRQVAGWYRQRLSGASLRLPIEKQGCRSAWHLFTIRHPKRDELQKYLAELGIGSSVHYPLPLHLQPCYAGLGYHAGDFPVTETAARQCLSLPMFPELTETQVDTVCRAVLKFLKERE